VEIVPETDVERRRAMLDSMEANENVDALRSTGINYEDAFILPPRQPGQNELDQPSNPRRAGEKNREIPGEVIDIESDEDGDRRADRRPERKPSQKSGRTPRVGKLQLVLARGEPSMLKPVLCFQIPRTCGQPRHPRVQASNWALLLRPRWNFERRRVLG
jgi:hypothetical protein